jgi:aspartyl-tRNA(Asn)/glutamyl-tRNA(Gln) amidotransferase subunit A
MTRRELLAAILVSPLCARRIAAAQAPDLTALTIAEALPRLWARDLAPIDLANAYLARIDRLENEFNAYITVTRELAQREARRLPDPRRGTPPPLFGIPIAHKDLFETRGVRTTAGSLLFEHHTPGASAALVQRLERAGAVMLGKTNTHELGGGVTTINPYFGTTRNPVAPDRVAGGSSGGSAAAVAARLCAAATGSDTGGSVRIPAAFCGCVGFKPTYGRLSTQGLLGASPSFDHVGFLTRTVEDARILFAAAAPASSASPAGGAAPAGRASPAGIRVGLPRAYFFDGLDAEVAAGVERALASMRARGAVVTDIELPVDAGTMARVFDPVFAFELWGRFGTDWRTNPGSFSKAFSAFFASERPTVNEYEVGLAALKQFQEQIDRVFDTVDAIATPTVPVTPPLMAGPVDGMTILRNTWPFNAAGTPAVSVPIPTPGLPVGLQLIGRRGEDDKLLQAARALTAS